MDTLEFLDYILPENGLYALYIGLPPNKKYTSRKTGQQVNGFNKFFDTKEQLAEAALLYDSKKCSVYHAIASYSDSRRTQANANSLKCVAVDLDVKEKSGYASKEEALKDLFKFISTNKLPSPLLVVSGHGVHVYWVFEEAKPVDEWRRAASLLKAAVMDYGLKADSHLITNSAQVLRPPKTHNRKTEKPLQVKVVASSAPVDFDAFCKLLDRFRPRSTSTSVALSKALVIADNFPPAVFTEVQSKCQQVQRAVEAPEEVREPLWYALMGLAGYCDKPAEAAHRWSEGHPGFNLKNSIDKMEQWKQKVSAPPTCAHFAKTNPEGCKGCPFNGHITTPAQLGAVYPEAESDTKVQVPKPFKRTDFGIAVTIDGHDIKVCDFDIYPVSYGYDEAARIETVRFMWDKKHVGWSDLCVENHLLNDLHLKDFVSAIGKRGIPVTTKRNSELLQMLLRSYRDQLRASTKPKANYSSMGWKHEGDAFVMGANIFSKVENRVEREPVSLSASIDAHTAEAYTTKGDFEEWKGATSVVDTDKNLFVHGFCLLVGFSAPLFKIAGLDGAVVSLLGKTGTGKTLSQLWTQSIYGDPKRLHTQSKFTANSIYTKMAFTGNLPVTIDEFTIVEDWVIDEFVYNVTQGREKSRLTRSGEYISPKEWSLPVIVSTNKSIKSVLSLNPSETEAQLYRILEFSVPPNNMFTENSDVGRKMYKFLNNNYGHAGQAFIQHLVSLGHKKISDDIERVHERFASKYGVEFSARERFWAQVFVLSDLAGEYAQQLGLIAFDHTSCINNTLGAIHISRSEVCENTEITTYENMAGFINEILRESLCVIRHNGRYKVVSEPVNFMAVKARLEMTDEDGSPKLFLFTDPKTIKTWMKKEGIDYVSALKQVPTTRTRCSLTEGSSIPGAVQDYYRFELPADTAPFLQKEIQKPSSSNVLPFSNRA
ncbi:MAG: DUF927 domain-containing protein [Candidatus Caldarchaeum sp.]